MAKIKIGIVDDHQAVAKGLSAVISSSQDMEVVFTIFDRQEISATLQSSKPDVLIMDVVMPGSSGIESFKQVLADYPDMKIIAYTALNSPMMIEMMLREGVRAYVNKNQNLQDLLEAIQEVNYDRRYLPEEYHFILKKLNGYKKPEELSRREVEILELISVEKKSPEIAEKLGISINTVETHRKHLFEKLKVSNVAGLIKAGIDQGYIK